MNILFCQFSTNFINKDTIPDISGVYYNSIYTQKKIDGYYKGADFWEIPLWIAEIAGSLPQAVKNLYIVKDISGAVDYINNSPADYILFSVLDINKNYILEIIKQCQNKNFIVGGYVDFTDFKSFKNVNIIENIPALCKFLKVEYKYNLDFTLFKGMKIIPRLTLSNGCLNVCKFCSIPKEIKTTSYRDILKQVKSFKDLSFKLVYLNDKTFGQAKNYILLGKLYKRIKKHNPDFKGFIIQTTTSQVIKPDFIREFPGLHIFAVELGIESFNNDILRELKKPQNIEIILRAIKILKSLNVKIIGNFVIGFLNETKKSYNNTLQFIRENKENFYLLNIYNLAIYKNTELSREINSTGKNDFNELSREKSFYNDTQKKEIEIFYKEIFKLGLTILKRG